MIVVSAGFIIVLEFVKRTMIHFHVISLFPESIEPYLSDSIIGRAAKDGKISINYFNPRDFTADKHKRVDSRPYGGGPGMVLEPESYLRAVDTAVKGKRNVEYIFFTPHGEQFTNETARELANVNIVNGKTKSHLFGNLPGFKGREKHIVLLCARYEGLDARVPKILNARHLSIGPFILTGGELPAAVVIDATARYVDGVLGSRESIEDNRIASGEVYTRPEILIYKGKEYKVPEVLLSGNHAEIDKWRRKH